jgi:hypothetical protein
MKEHQMRSKRQRLAAVTLLSGLTTLGIGLSAGPASAALTISDCIDHLGKAQSGSLQMTGTPAAGSVVPAGSSIAVQASWTAADFEETDGFWVCGTVGGVFDSAVSSEDKGVGNDGSLTAASSLPSSLPVDSDVCLVGVLKGRLANKTQGTMVSETLCYTSAAVATTTTTAAPITKPTAPAADPVNTGAGTPSAPAVEAAPVVEAEIALTPAPLPQLPRTGSGVDMLAGLGGISIALGGLTRFLGRRRPAEG